MSILDQPEHSFAGPLRDYHPEEEMKFVLHNCKQSFSRKGPRFYRTHRVKEPKVRCSTWVFTANGITQKSTAGNANKRQGVLPMGRTRKGGRQRAAEPSPSGSAWRVPPFGAQTHEPSSRGIRDGGMHGIKTDQHLVDGPFDDRTRSGHQGQQPIPQQEETHDPEAWAWAQGVFACV